MSVCSPAHQNRAFQGASWHTSHARCAANPIASLLHLTNVLGGRVSGLVRGTFLDGASFVSSESFREGRGCVELLLALCVAENSFGDEVMCDY